MALSKKDLLAKASGRKVNVHISDDDGIYISPSNPGALVHDVITEIGDDMFEVTHYRRQSIQDEWREGSTSYYSITHICSIQL